MANLNSNQSEKEQTGGKSQQTGSNQAENNQSGSNRASQEKGPERTSNQGQKESSGGRTDTNNRGHVKGE